MRRVNEAIVAVAHVLSILEKVAYVVPPIDALRIGIVHAGLMNLLDLFQIAEVVVIQM